MLVHALERSKQRAKIYGNIRDCHLPKVRPKVAVAEIWKNGNDLVGVTKGRDERADRCALS